MKFIYHFSRTFQAIHALLARQQRYEAVEFGTGVVECSQALALNGSMCLNFKDCRGNI